LLRSGCFHSIHWLYRSTCPPHFELLAQAVGCSLLSDSHLDICDVWTLYALLYGMALYRRPRLLHLLSTTPNEAVSAGLRAVKALWVVSSCEARVLSLASKVAQ